MVLEILPALADQSIGLVVVVQDLKIKLGMTVIILYTVCASVYVCVWVCMHIIQLTNNFCLLSGLRGRDWLRQYCAGGSYTTCWRLLL